MNGQLAETIHPRKAKQQETKTADLIMKTITDTEIEITKAADDPDNLYFPFYIGDSSIS